VKPGDGISIVLPYPMREVELLPEDIPLNVLYEDEHILVIDKQAGLVVHPGHGNWTGTLVNALLFHFGKLPTTPGAAAAAEVSRLRMRACAYGLRTNTP
jgi:23S rRNA pseudouridine1911/1915/1917 synthase